LIEIFPKFWFPASAVRRDRVAATPETVKRMVKEGFHVTVEAGPAPAAYFPDAEYVAAGAEMAGTPTWKQADVILQVAAPGPGDITEAGGWKQLHPGPS